MRGVVIAEARLGRGSGEGVVNRLRNQTPTVVLQMVSLREAPVAKEVEMIAEQTKRAMTHGSLLAEKPEVDLLLRLAGTTQIAEAISRIGYRRDGRRFVIAFGSRRGLESLKEALRGDGRFRLIEEDAPRPEDLSVVEAAALLAAKS